MGYKSAEKSQEYVAPLLGNGAMCIHVDYEGCMTDERRTEKISYNPGMRIWRAGRRRYDNTLMPFGSFRHKFENSIMLREYAQELDTKNAVVKTKCKYDGIEIESTIAVHHDCNLIMINRKMHCMQDISYCFEYVLDNIKKDFWIDKIKRDERSIEAQYCTVNGQKGIINVFSDDKMTTDFKDGIFSLKCDIPSGEKELTFYILFSDNIESDEYLKKSEEIKNSAMAEGYDVLIKHHESQWHKYYAEGYVVTDNADINEVYNTAQYHLKCNTTPWSVPVGLSDALWQGRYFAFDEFYMMMPLLSSNHINSAYKIPHFRAEGLAKAIKRASSPHSVRQARYPWETLENGDEGSSIGYWHDHVFHMACIAMGEYYYYKYTGDKQFLIEEGYPVIKACAMFYINQILCEVADGSLKVSKCTDLERLGASVPNGYMTACGIIKTIQIFCETANILGLDEANEYSHFAKRLYDALPNDGKKYIPHDGCTDTSIGLMGGIYPFDVIDKNDVFQKNGIMSYLSQENSRGNMYALGSGTCPWYKAWKSIVLGRIGKIDAAYDAVKEVTDNTGNFNEMYEINDTESGTVFRPWFGTASGMFIQAVNEMFVRSEDGIIYIGAALPREVKDFSFKLAVYGGIVVEGEISDNCIKTLRLTNRTRKGYIDVAVRKHLSLAESYDVMKKEHNEEYYLLRCKITEE